MEYLLDDSWAKIDTIIPYGYGRVGKRVLPKLMEMFAIPFVIDNNPQYQSEKEVTIYGIDDALKRRTNEKIVVLTVETAYTKIRSTLIERGLVEYKDFCILERFFGEWFLKYQGKCYLSKIDTVLTSRCSLNCGHCAMFIGYGNRVDYDIESIKENFDLFFKVVDYVLEYSLLGGEPLIHKDIVEIVRYLGEKYGERIGQMVLITNGNVKPSDEVIDTLKKYKVILSISDYTKVHDYQKVLNKFIEKLNNANIPFYYNVEMEWKDHGYPEKPCQFSDEDMPAHMKMCGHSTHSINEGKLYYCDAMYGAEKNTNYETQKDDIVDFQELVNISNLKNAKECVIKYCSGQINKRGFPSFCRYCGGIGHDNKNVVTPGT